MGVSAPNLMVVHPSLPVKSIRDLIALAKTRANQGDPILYASGGTGTNGHLATALFLSMAQIRMTHVPYKSGSLALIDVIAGQVADDDGHHVERDVPGLGRQAARTRRIQHASCRRRARHPDHRRGGSARLRVGAMVRSARAGGDAAGNHRLAAPRNPAALRAPNIKERLAADGLEVVANSPDEFAALIRADIAKWTKVVKTIAMSLI